MYRLQDKEDRRKAFPAALPDKKLTQIKDNVFKAAENLKQMNRSAKVTVDVLQKQVELIEQPQSPKSPGSPSTGRSLLQEAFMKKLMQYKN